MAKKQKADSSKHLHGNSAKAGNPGRHVESLYQGNRVTPSGRRGQEGQTALVNDDDYARHFSGENKMFGSLYGHLMQAVAQALVQPLIFVRRAVVKGPIGIAFIYK